MSSLVPSDIINQACKQLGSSMQVANWQTDIRAEAVVARAFYQQSLEEILRDFDWPFARVQQRLTLLVEGYSRERHFAYAYPAGCSCIRRVFSPEGFNRNDDQQSAQRYIIAEIPNPPYPLGPGQEGLSSTPFPPGSVHNVPPPPPEGNGPRPMVKVLLADHKHLCVEFTATPEIVNDFPADFKAALMFKLGFYMAPSLFGSLSDKVGARMLMMYTQTIQTAAMHAYNEELQDQQRPGEFIDVRRRHGAYLGGEVLGQSPGISGFEVG